MSDFGLFESDEAAANEPRRQARTAARKLDAAIDTVRANFGRFLLGATGIDEFEDRWHLSKNDIRASVEPLVFPNTGTMRRIQNAMKSDWKLAHPYKLAIDHDDAGFGSMPTGDSHRNQDLDETYHPSSGNLIPEGNFEGYKDSVDQNGPEKVESNDFTPGGDSGSDKHARRRTANPAKEFAQHLMAQGIDPNSLLDDQETLNDHLADYINGHPGVSDEAAIDHYYQIADRLSTHGFDDDLPSQPGPEETYGHGDVRNASREAARLVADIYTDFARSNGLRVASLDTLDRYASTGIHDADYRLLQSMIIRAAEDCSEECDDEDKDDDSDSEAPSESESDESDSGDDSDEDYDFGGEDDAEGEDEASEDDDESDEDGDGDHDDEDHHTEDSDEEYDFGGDEGGEEQGGGEQYTVPEHAPELPPEMMGEIPQDNPQGAAPVPPEVIDSLLGLPEGTIEQLLLEEVEQGAQGGDPGMSGAPMPQGGGDDFFGGGGGDNTEPPRVARRRRTAATCQHCDADLKKDDGDWVDKHTGDEYCEQMSSDGPTDRRHTPGDGRQARRRQAKDYGRKCSECKSNNTDYSSGTNTYDCYDCGATFKPYSNPKKKSPEKESRRRSARSFWAAEGDPEQESDGGGGGEQQAAPAQDPAAAMGGGDPAAMGMGQPMMPPPGSQAVTPPQPPAPLENQPAEDALLDTANQAIMQMIDQETAEYQQIIDPLSQALQAIQFAQQVEQSEHPMDVTPPEGTVNVDPSAAPGGAQAMQQQARRRQAKVEFGIHSAAKLIAARYRLSATGHQMLLNAALGRRGYEHVVEALKLVPAEVRQAAAIHMSHLFAAGNQRFNKDVFMKTVMASNPRDRAGDAWRDGRDRGEREHGRHDMDDFGDDYSGWLNDADSPLLDDGSLDRAGYPSHLSNDDIVQEYVQRKKQEYRNRPPVSPDASSGVWGGGGELSNAEHQAEMDRIERSNRNPYQASRRASRGRLPFDRSRLAGETWTNTPTKDAFEFPNAGEVARVDDNNDTNNLPPMKGADPHGKNAASEKAVDRFQRWQKSQQQRGLPTTQGESAVHNFLQTRNPIKKRVGPEAADMIHRELGLNPDSVKTPRAKPLKAVNPTLKGKGGKTPAAPKAKAPAPKAVPKTASFFTRKVSGWRWDDHLNGYLSKEARAFTCACGERIAAPSYKTCGCGKVWNVYAIGDSHHLASDTASMYIAREIEVRPGVVMANRKMAAPDRWFEHEQEDLHRQRRQEEDDADAWAEKRMNTPHRDDGAYREASRKLANAGVPDIRDHVHEIDEEGLPYWLDDKYERQHAKSLHEIGDHGRFADFLADRAYNKLTDANLSGDDQAADEWYPRSCMTEDYHKLVQQHLNGGHTAAKTAKDGDCTCWEGYERVPGTEPCASKSCRKKTGATARAQATFKQYLAEINRLADWTKYDSPDPSRDSKAKPPSTKIKSQPGDWTNRDFTGPTKGQWREPDPTELPRKTRKKK